MIDSPPTEVVQEAATQIAAYADGLWRALAERFDLPVTTHDALRLPQIDFYGLTVIVEYWEGERRHGAPNPLPVPYGYIARTSSAEGEHEQMDCFLCGSLPIVYVIDSYKPDGTFDEHKLMLGAATPQHAYDIFRKAYTPEFRTPKAITTMTVGQVKKWLAEGDVTKPFQRES